MKLRASAAVCFVALSSFAGTIVAPSKSELAALYDKAVRELGASHYDVALKELDAIDARQPGLAETENLRGVVLMREGKYDQGGAALSKALEIDPKFIHARFNLADIPFLKKDWAQARDRFDALQEDLPSAGQDAIGPLIEYKILLTFLFENKEEKIGAILSELKERKESPAFAYAEAAIAFHRNKRADGQEWMAAAQKDFAAQENGLFLESFYEVDWLPRPAGEAPAMAEFNSRTERTRRRSADAQRNLEQVKHYFAAREFDRALTFLDPAEEGAPKQAASWNLRAEILLEQKKFPEAEAALAKAAAADPRSWETKYISAQVPFRKKDYAESRARMEALLAAAPGGLTNESAQLIRYHIFLTLLLEGKESAAQQNLEKFKFTDETPAFYYAQAAWNFQHHNPEQASEWVASAGKLFSPALNSACANPLADLGWLGTQTARPEMASAPASMERDSATSSAPHSPALVSSPANSSPVPLVTEKNTPTPAALVEGTPAPPRPALASKPSPPAAASAAGETPDPTRGDSLGKTKRKRPRAKATVTKTEASPPAQIKARRLPPIASTATPTPVPLASASPAPTPPPPFLRRLARTLLRPFKKREQKIEGGGNYQPGASQPAKSKAAPAGGTLPRN